MSRQLNASDRAYNACVEVINECDTVVADQMGKRDRAWQAAEALAPIGTHGINGARLTIVNVPRKKRKR